MNDTSREARNRAPSSCVFTKAKSREPVRRHRRKARFPLPWRWNPVLNSTTRQEALRNVPNHRCRLNRSCNLFRPITRIPQTWTDIVRLFIGATFYGLNKLFAKSVITSVPLWTKFCHNYLNDTIAGFAFPAYCNLVFRLFHRRRFERLWSIIGMVLFAGAFWEIVPPFVFKHGVSDPYDIVAYCIGATIYWVSLHGCVSPASN